MTKQMIQPEPPAPGERNPAVPVSTHRKALLINLDPLRYGTFAEIGAGQEVARHFFQAGGAAGTVAKSMSAYDMKFSDEIYGKAVRYVSRERLQQMLDHEYSLLIERLGPTRGNDTCFFVFADTVAARNYLGTNECHGWMGVRYQLEPGGPAHEIILHVRMLDRENALQQDALGIIGVNLLHGAFNFSQSPKRFVAALKDNLSNERIEVDMLEFHGPDHAGVDNRLLSLRLVEEGLTQAVVFGPGRSVLQPSEVLRKKAILIERGLFRPVTWVNLDMLQGAEAQFVGEARVAGEEILKLFELTLPHLQSNGSATMDQEDFLARVDGINALGHCVLVSSYFEYFRLSAYLRRYTALPIGVVLGISTLLDIFTESYYENLPGGILEAFGRLFRQDVRLYLYPMLGSALAGHLTEKHAAQQTVSAGGVGDPDVMVTADNLEVSPNLRNLYAHLLENRHIVPVAEVDRTHMTIHSRDVLRRIQAREPDWQALVPPAIARLIEERNLWTQQAGR